MKAASADTFKDLTGPSGAGQVIVYLPAGVYEIDPIDMESDVRFEIEPGAVIRPRPGAKGSGPGDWGLFTFGSLTKAVRNVTFTAGDGCGGPGKPLAAGASEYKPNSTDFRHNSPDKIEAFATPSLATRGMGNAAIPFNGYWPVERMWVLDLDPRATQADWQVIGFHVRNAFDIRLEYVFTIQNAEQIYPGGGEVTGITSKATAMMINPPTGAPYTPVVEDQAIAHRLHVNWHYNILSPSGQGANQIRGCLDCSFEHVFSHGGNALRAETDGIKTKCPKNACSCTGNETGIEGKGFQTYSRVDGLVADRIEGAYGNNAVSLTPHCLPNGTVTISHVRGTSMGGIIAMAGPEGMSTSGTFTQATVTGVEGCGGDLAEEAMPQINAYTLVPAGPAIKLAPDAKYGQFAGLLSWPKPPAVGGIADGNIPPGNYTLTHPAACPAPWSP